MEKIFLSLSLVLLGFSNINSQTNKGNFILGGSLNASYTEKSHDNLAQSEISYTDLNFSPRIGYFVKNNFAIGIDIPLSYTTSKDYKYYSYGAGPFLRWYLGKNKTKFLIQTEFNYNKTHEKHYNYYYSSPNNLASTTSTYKGKIYSLDFGPGLAYFFNEHIALEGLLFYQSKFESYFNSYNYLSSYSNSNQTNEIKWDTQKICFAVGLQIHFGRTQEEKK